MHVTSPGLQKNVRQALADPGLQQALARTGPQFLGRRAAAVAGLPEFEQPCATSAATSRTTPSPTSISTSKPTPTASPATGGQVHWCATAEDARDTVLDICRQAGALTVTKGKSMVSEEIGLNDYLEAHGITPVETDLGEYIIQLRHEPPSHIIAPAIHLNRDDWEEAFRRAHTDLPPDRVFHERRDILTEARTRLREKFLAADVGITGANFLIAETGSERASSPTKATAT